MFNKALTKHNFIIIYSRWARSGIKSEEVDQAAESPLSWGTSGGGDILLHGDYFGAQLPPHARGTNYSPNGITLIDHNVERRHCHRAYGW